MHAWSNATALALYALSRKARRNGNRGRARALSLAGASALGAAGYLGGHLTFAKGVGPDQTVFDPGPDEWTEAGEVPDGRSTRVVVDDTPVLLVRADGSLYALHDRCSHRGCSLADGELDGLEVVCACHGSRFDLRDGSVKQGPATAPQPAFETRERDGQDRNSPHRLTRSGRLPWMAVRGVEDTQTVEHQAALLRVALLVARDAPQEELFNGRGRGDRAAVRRRVRLGRALRRRRARRDRRRLAPARAARPSGQRRGRLRPGDHRDGPGACDPQPGADGRLRQRAAATCPR